MSFERPPLRGLSHAEVVSEEEEDEGVPYLVEDLAPAGSLGIFSGLPESYKTFAALELAARVAGAGGSLFGRFDVTTTGPVGFFWSDDSTAAEMARIRAFSSANDLPADLAIRWYLNEPLLLPHDVDLLGAEVARRGFVLVVMDSLYDYLDPRMSLKDDEVARAVVALKHSVADATGASVVVVDHAPWSARRTFGSVFKVAAARFNVFFERREGEEGVRLTAHGNDIAGFRNRNADFDRETLSLRVSDLPDETAEEIEARETAILAAVESLGDPTGDALNRAVPFRDERVRASRDSMLERGLLVLAPKRDPDRGRTRRYALPSGSSSQSSRSSQVVPDELLLSRPEPPRRGSGRVNDDDLTGEGPDELRPAHGLPSERSSSSAEEETEPPIPIPGDPDYVAWLRAHRHDFTEAQRRDLMERHRSIRDAGPHDEEEFRRLFVETFDAREVPAGGSPEPEEER